MGLALVAGVGLLIAFHQGKKDVCQYLGITSATESGNSAVFNEADFLINVNNLSSSPQEISIFLEPLDSKMKITENSSQSVTIPKGISQLVLSMIRKENGIANLKVTLMSGEKCSSKSFNSNQSI